MQVRLVRLQWISVLVVFSMVLSACVGVTPAPAAVDGTGPLRVVATYSILGDLVQNIAGENIELTVLVGPDGDSHVYEPTPQDAVALAKADLVFENGLEFETWLDDLYESSGSTALRIVVSDDIDPLPFEGHDPAPDHENGESDPHIWHDPNNAVVMVKNIRAALVEADPANADTYNANAEAYTAQLTELDAAIREQVATIAEANRILITSHDTFGYFADEYGFEISSAIASVSTEAADPSAGEIAELVEFIQAEGVPALFAENVTNPDLMQRIADEAGVVLAANLYTDALGQAGTPGATYLEMMRYNIDTIAAALH